MAPCPTLKSQAKPCTSDDENRPDSQTSLDILMTVREMLETNKKRRNSKRKGMEVDQGKRIASVVQKIDTLFEARKTKVTKAQKEQWVRLDNLNQRRVGIETQILSSMKSIEQRTANVSSEMTAMLDGRLEDLQEQDGAEAVIDSDQ